MLFDGMAVVNVPGFYKYSINNCSDLHSYDISYVLFDKYTAKSSMTDDTRQQRTGGKPLYKPAYKVEDSTQIRDCLVGKKSKEIITLFFSSNVVEKNKSVVTTVTLKGVLLNQPA